MRHVTEQSILDFGSLVGASGIESEAERIRMLPRLLLTGSSRDIKCALLGGNLTSGTWLSHGVMHDWNMLPYVIPGRRESSQDADGRTGFQMRIINGPYIPLYKMNLHKLAGSVVGRGITARGWGRLVEQFIRNPSIGTSANIDTLLMRVFSLALNEGCAYFHVTQQGNHIGLLPVSAGQVVAPKFNSDTGRLETVIIIPLNYGSNSRLPFYTQTSLLLHRSWVSCLPLSFILYKAGNTALNRSKTVLYENYEFNSDTGSYRIADRKFLRSWSDIPLIPVMINEVSPWICIPPFIDAATLQLEFFDAYTDLIESLRIALIPMAALMGWPEPIPVGHGIIQNSNPESKAVSLPNTSPAPQTLSNECSRMRNDLSTMMLELAFGLSSRERVSAMEVTDARHQQTTSLSIWERQLAHSLTLVLRMVAIFFNEDWKSGSVMFNRPSQINNDINTIINNNRGDI